MIVVIDASDQTARHRGLSRRKGDAKSIVFLAVKLDEIVKFGAITTFIPIVLFDAHY